MMQDKNNSSNKNKFNLKNITHSAGFSSFTSALMAIVLGLVFGFIVMLVAAMPNRQNY